MKGIDLWCRAGADLVVEDDTRCAIGVEVHEVDEAFDENLLTGSPIAADVVKGDFAAAVDGTMDFPGLMGRVAEVGSEEIVEVAQVSGWKVADACHESRVVDGPGETLLDQ